MKAIMYHYVREPSDAYPRLRFLHIDNFCRQLDALQENFVFPSVATFLEGARTGALPDNAAVLTFDDGLADHYNYVFPELLKRDLWGFFFPAAAPYQTKGLLNVHRIHMITALHPAGVLLDALKGMIEDQMLVDRHKKSFETQPYRYRDDDEDLKLFKRMLNYYISDEWRETVIDQLEKIFLPDTAALCDTFYLSPGQMREMHDGGMVLGGHSVTHRVMSRLTANEQRSEILDSFDFLEGILGKLKARTFCYPYGGDHTFTDETIDLLEQANCQVGFSVEPRDINAEDLRTRKLALPRYDCTMFPHGHSENG